jgi:hypothetical protein
MEINGLFETLAGYLDFFIDFMLFRGMEKYTRLGSVSPTLVAFYVTGVFIAYLVSSVRKRTIYGQLLKQCLRKLLKKMPKM